MSDYQNLLKSLGIKSAGNAQRVSAEDYNKITGVKGADVLSDLFQETYKQYKANSSAESGTSTDKKETSTQLKWDTQKKKEDRLEAKSPINAIQIKRDRTKKEYDDYVNSDEYKNKNAEGEKKAAQDETARRLRAEMEQAEKEHNQAEDKKRFEADMEVINGLSEEDRKLLETYSASKYSDRELPEEDLVDSLLEDFGRERLDELERTYSRYRNAKYAEEVDAKAREFVSKGYGRGILANILSVPVQAYTGIIGTGGQLAEMTKGTGGYKTMDPNAYGTIGQTFTGAIREQTAENINEAAGGGLWGTLASDGYQGVMAMADDIARVFLGGGSLGAAGLAATGSFSQAMADASRQGATPAQAALMATGTAFIEAATEKLPLDNLIKIAKGKGGVSAVLNVLRQAGIEILEEEASLVGTLILEAGVMQEKSGYNVKVNDLIVNGGLTPEQAKEQAAKDLFWEVINTALVSGISGGLGGFGAVKANENGLIPADAEDAETQGKQDSEAEQETETKQEQQKAQEKQAEAEAARAVLEAVAQEHAAKVPKSQPQPVSEGMRHVNNAAAAINNVAPQQQAPAAPVAQPVQNPVQSKPKETPKPVQSQQQATVQQPVQAPQAPAVQPVQTVQAQQPTQAVQPVQPQQTPQNNQPVQPSQPVQTAQPQNTQTAASQQQQPQAVQKEAPKKGKKIYFHFNGFASDTAFFNDSKNQGSSKEDLNFSINDDNSLYLDLKGQGERYKNISGWMDRSGLGYLYNVYADGQLVTNPKAASGYYSLAKAEVTARPVLQKLVGGNLIPQQKGEIHFYSDNFNKSTQSNQNAQAQQASAPVTETATQPSVNTQVQETQQPQAAQEPQTQEQIPTQDNAPVYDESPYSDFDKYIYYDEEPGIKGTGAAEQNFTEKPAYNATLSEDNAQEDRRDDVRPMELPKQDIQGDNISAVTGNVYGSKITSDELASLMEEPTAKGDFTYAKISNDQATQKATETIAKAGTWEKAYDSWKQSVSAGNAGAEMSARGALFLNHAAQQGNKQLWLETLHYMQKLGTNTAQGLQAFRIIRSLNAPDKIEFAKMSVQKMVDELHYDVQIDEKLLDDYENAKTDEERDRILSDIQQNVADQIPSTILDKLNALRYMNMLGNLKTNVRNVLGNAGSAIVYRMKDQIATSLEKIAGTERTKSHTVSKALLNACKQDFEQVKSTVNSGGKYSDKSDSSDSFRQGVMDKRKIFKNPLLESYRKGTNWMMNNAYFGDEAFGKAAYARALAGYLKANGVKDTDLTKVDAKLLDKARAYAVQQAQEATFKDNSALAQIVTGIQKQTGIVGQGLMPFTKTPANVLTRAVEYSPLGIIDSTIKTVKAKKNTDITGADIVNSWAKTMTGTALFALGAALQDQGLLVGGPDDDEEKAEFDELNGRQNYAFSLPDGTSYTLDWMTPAAMPMFMGAQMWKIWTDDKDVTFADLENVFTSIADPMIQMSMLQGLNDSLASIKHSDNNLGQFLMNAAVSYLTQGLTNTLLGQLERSTEENRQTTYVDKDSSVPEWMQLALGKASQKIPGWDFQQQDYVNAWGETEKNEGGLLYNLLSPGYISKEKADQLSDELNRIHKETGENVYPAQAPQTVTYKDKDGTTHTDYNLTGEQYQTYATTQGQTARSIAEALIGSDNYNALSDEQKAEAFKLAYQYAREKAEQAALPDSQGYSESWMMEMKDGKEAEYIIRKVGTAMLSGAMGKLDAAWDNGYSKANQQALSEQLRQDYDSYKALDAAARRTIYEAASGTTRKYLEARSKGVSHDDFLKAAKAVNDVNGTGKYDPDTSEAIARTPGISPATKDAIMRAYMPDYDPKASSPDYTELKYAYIREKLKLSPQEYARTYRAVRDNPKDSTDDDVLVDMGYDPQLARTLAGIYNSTKAGKAAYMDYYNSKK